MSKHNKKHRKLAKPQSNNYNRADPCCQYQNCCDCPDRNTCDNFIVNAKAEFEEVYNKICLKYNS